MILEVGHFPGGGFGNYRNCFPIDRSLTLTTKHSHQCQIDYEGFADVLGPITRQRTSGSFSPRKIAFIYKIFLIASGQLVKR